MGFPDANFLGAACRVVDDLNLVRLNGVCLNVACLNAAIVRRCDAGEAVLVAADETGGHSESVLP